MAPGSIPGPDVTCGLSYVLVLDFTPRFSPSPPVLPPPQKNQLPNSKLIWKEWTEKSHCVQCPLLNPIIVIINIIIIIIIIFSISTIIISIIVTINIIIIFNIITIIISIIVIINIIIIIILVLLLSL